MMRGEPDAKVWKTHATTNPADVSGAKPDAKKNGATEDELQEAIAYGMMAPGGRAKNFAKAMLEELEPPGEESS